MKLRILLLILVLPVLFFACALLLTWAPLPDPFPPPFGGVRDQIAAILTGILGAGYLIGLAVYVIASFLRAGRALDPVLTSAGLVPEGYLAFGRRCRGVIRGREVEVTFLPSQGVSAAQLNVYVSASLGTRVAIARGKPLLDCSDCPRVNLDEALFGGLEVYSRDRESARRLLADAKVRGALQRLLDAGDVVGSREMYLQPERTWLRARPRGLTEGLFRQWLDELIALAEAGERVLEHRSAGDTQKTQG
jgi:hypothetical protein